MQASRPDRNHPTVRAKLGPEQRKPLEPGDAFSENDRRWGWEVISGRTLELLAQRGFRACALRRSDGIAEQGRRAEVATADHDQPEPRDIRNAPVAPDQHHLAARRRARPRAAPRAEIQPAVEAVHRAEPEIGAADRTFAVENRRDGGSAEQRRQRAAGTAIKDDVRL